MNSNTSFPHPLLALLACPRTGADLAFVPLGDQAALVSVQDGVAYPVINNVVLMCPAAPQIKSICDDFLARNGQALKQAGVGYQPELTRATLCGPADSPEAEWHEKEMAYWEARFQERLTNDPHDNPGWNRTLPRKQILDRLPGDLRKKTVLEIGCGASHTLFDVFGPTLEHYIGLDLSYYACLLTQQSYPNGLFLQASAEQVPLKKNSVEMAFAYGVFHHLPDHEANVVPLMSVIAQNGFLVGSDPLLKPRIPRLRLGGGAKPLPADDLMPSGDVDLRTGMSPHNEWIDWDNLIRLIGDTGDVTAAHAEYSPLRHVLVKAFYDKMGIRGRSFTRTLMALDRVWLATVGKLHRSLGPAGIHYAIRKR